MHPPGQVVVLNGTASAGKTTLAKAIHSMARGMWVVIGQDDVAQNLIPKWLRVDTFDGGHGDAGFRFVRDDAGLMHVEAGSVGRRLLRGYRYAVGACARAGNDVLVDECKFDPDGWNEWSAALEGISTTWVRVECALELCEQREASRPDRQLLRGLARGQYERAHADARYDLVVDLTPGDVEGCARSILRMVEP